MRTRRVIVVAALAAAGALAVAGCGSGGVSSSTAGGGGAPAAADRRPAELDAAAKGAAGAQTQNQAQNQAPAAQPVPATQRQVVRTAQISVEVDDIYQAAQKARDVGARFDGYVSDEKTDGDSASLELKVASGSLDDALTALAGLGPKVLNRSQQAQDVTEQIVDIQARVATQKASVERVRALLSNATGIGDIVQIESELTRRQAELESLEQRAAVLSGQTQLATVTVRLSRPGGVAAAADDNGFLGGLNAGWEVFVASTKVLLTVLGALLPFLIALAVPAAVIVSVLRRRRPVPRPAAPATAEAGKG